MAQSLENCKITGYAVSIKNLPDKIENQADWLKAQFDARTDDEVKQQHNALCELLKTLGVEESVTSEDIRGIRVGTLGSLEWKDADGEWHSLGTGGGVVSFAGRAGAVEPQAGDYTAADVGAYTKAETDAKLAEKADTDGAYPDMTAGSTDRWQHIRLVNTAGENQPYYLGYDGKNAAYPVPSSAISVEQSVNALKLKGIDPWQPADGAMPAKFIPVGGSVTEIGRYLDFHLPGSNKDYDARLEARSDGAFNGKVTNASVADTLGGVLSSKLGGTGQNKTVLQITTKVVTTDGAGQFTLDGYTGNVCAVGSVGSISDVNAVFVGFTDNMDGHVIGRLYDGANGAPVPNRTVRINILIYSI